MSIKQDVDPNIADAARRAAAVAARYATEVDIEERFPEEALAALSEEGLLGLAVPKEYGGLGANSRTASLVVEEVAAACASTGAILLTWAGPITGLVDFGTSEQKSKYLPEIAAGRCKLSFALTEEHCGSDAGAITTTAVLDGDHYVLDGKKAWIGNAINADLTLVAAKTDPTARAKGVSSFLVENGTAGLAVEEIYSKMGARGTKHGDLVLRAVRVPRAQLLGQEGRGLAQMLQSLDYIRLMTAAHALGIARSAYEAAVGYAKTREVFGSRLHKNQAISFLIADCATQLHASRLIMLDAAADLDAGKSIGAKAAMAKLHSSEIATRIAHASVQVHGAWGLKKGNAAERAYRDARITEVWDGTSEIQKLIIAREIFGRD
ncbi:acyl-CoA dehydrogenase family protein [Oryzicola mucosus]|uniref:3-sulfinopropanoyl-CoA desulfinase n=1 Tax=Oryzicola mucosus TaxID=2767425 RepID=A0A8J6PX43_9HYPH|nr:acyl-CoA dehydrogenase family protein [Oryzicola mucosus]MBD0416761.1 acyl-CoA dehydrogenase family protein [Oryzicola mucosus]